MKRPLIALTLAALAACGGDNDEEAGDEPVTAADSAAVAERAAILSEPEALGLLKAIGEAEIAMASAARAISQNDAVLAYARVVVADHQGIAQLITAPVQDNAMSSAVRAAGDSITREFLGMQGGFNNTYIEEQVKAHQQALQLMDTAIIPSVRDSAMRDLLVQIRPTIAAHLQRAMQILATRRKEAQDRGEAWVSGFARTPAPVPAAPAVSQPQPQPQQRPEPPQTVPEDTLVPPTTTDD